MPPLSGQQAEDYSQSFPHSVLSFCFSMVADVPDLHHLPTEIANCIAERLTAAQLLNVEEREGFQSLKLGQKSSLDVSDITSFILTVPRVKLVGIKFGSSLNEV